MNSIRDILLEYWWRKDKDFSRIKVFYIHRGVEGNIKVVEGMDIQRINKSFMYLKEAQIPLHRIIKIEYDGREIFKRRSR